MLDKEGLIKDIRKALANLSTYLQMGGKLNLTDSHVQSESFVQDLLNAVYGWQLVSTNQSTANYPCIDLIDTTQKLGVQVSSDNSSTKLNDTLACLASHGLAGTITALKAFVLGRKQGQYTIKSPYPGVTFDWQSDVLDFEDVLKATNTLPDAQIRVVHHCVVEAMPDIFPQHRTARQPAVMAPPLPDLAARILIAAVAGKHNKVYVSWTQYGQNISTDDTKFLEDSNDGRKNAAHLAAVEELVNRGLIKDKWGKGNVFAVTNEGFIASDEAKKRLPPEPSDEVKAILKALGSGNDGQVMTALDSDGFHVYAGRVTVVATKNGRVQADYESAIEEMVRSGLLRVEGEDNYELTRTGWAAATALATG